MKAKLRSSLVTPKAAPLQRKSIITVAVLAGCLAVVIWFIVVDISGRTPAAYCRVLASERSRLSKIPGTSYPSVVFNTQVDDPREYAKSFAALETVAPSNVRNDTKALKELYEKMNNTNRGGWEPLVRAPLDRNINEWAKKHCGVPN